MKEVISRKLSRGFWTLQEILSTDETNESNSTTARQLIWQSVVPLIIVAGVLNSAAFLFITAPQNYFQLLTDTLPQLSRTRGDVEVADALLKDEPHISDRLDRRVRELNKLVAVVGPVDQKQYQHLIDALDQNAVEAAKDLGTVSAFAHVGLEFSREWANVEEKTLTAEVKAWEAAKYLVEVRMKYGLHASQSGDAVRAFDHQRLELISNTAAFAAYSKRMEPVIEAAVQDARRQSDAVDFRVNHLGDVLSMSRDVLRFCELMIVLAAIRWLINRIAVLSKKRRELIATR